MTELKALIGSREIGVLQNDRGRTRFVYRDDWREQNDAYPLSLSMPLTAKEHDVSVTEAYLWGLLPDNEAVLDRWAQKYQVSARNVFALISHVGEDCAGAVRFTANLDVDDGDDDRRIEWLSDAQIADRLKDLKNDHAAWRQPRDVGQFSLAGAQPKTALLFKDGRWGLPSGPVPTTHILKPPTGEFDGHAENEHFCLVLAKALGMPVAVSRVARFKQEVAIVVERYDRNWRYGKIVRIHQEDTCQALGRPPSRKYQNQGGPGVVDIVNLLRDQSSARADDVDVFVQAVIFNWLIAGTDAHAKNYSLLLAEGPRVRLAPLYDIASILPYKKIDLKKAKLSMKIGDVYELSAVSSREWEKLAKAIRVDFAVLREQILGMAAKIPDFSRAVRDQVQGEGLNHELIGVLGDGLARRAEECAKLFELG